MEISENLKSSRKKSKLTQVTVSKKLHVTRQTVSQWETGKSTPDLDTLEQLSDLYQCPICVLLGETNTSIQTKVVKMDEGLLLLLITCVQFLMAPIGIIVIPIIAFRNKKINSYYKTIYILSGVAFLYNLLVGLIFILLFMQY